MDNKQIRCDMKDCRWLNKWNCCGKFSIDMHNKQCMTYHKKED